MNPETSSGGGKRPPNYTEEFKRSVVDHWCHGDKTAEQVAREFGVKVWNVRDWRRRYGPTHKPVDAPLPETPEELNSNSCVRNWPG
jgi:transposase-like protein